MDLCSSQWARVDIQNRRSPLDRDAETKDTTTIPILDRRTHMTPQARAVQMQAVLWTRASARDPTNAIAAGGITGQQHARTAGTAQSRNTCLTIELCHLNPVELARRMEFPIIPPILTINHHHNAHTSQMCRVWSLPWMPSLLPTKLEKKMLWLNDLVSGYNRLCHLSP